jgi:hypothetical protein
VSVARGPYGCRVGLDAFVYCRCWQDSLAAAPPCAPELVGFDEDGYLSLLLPYPGNEAAHDAFDEWLRRGCPHEDMTAAAERVSNWGGYRMFQDALRSTGPTRFPTLLAELPDTNAGRMPAEAAARMLDELDHFTRHAVPDDQIVLVDEATGKTLLEHISAYDGVTMVGPGYGAGVDRDGFFVRDPDTDPPVTLFRSMRFRQRVLDERRVEFVDGRTTAAVAMPPVGGRVAEPPQLLRVEYRPRTAADFEYIVEPLRVLCRAAVATGNPVIWT